MLKAQCWFRPLYIGDPAFLRTFTMPEDSTQINVVAARLPDFQISQVKNLSHGSAELKPDSGSEASLSPPRRLTTSLRHFRKKSSDASAHG